MQARNDDWDEVVASKEQEKRWREERREATKKAAINKFKGAEDQIHAHAANNGNEKDGDKRTGV